MSTNRKALKIMSFIFAIGGVISIALGAMGFASGSIPGYDSADLAVYGGSMIVFGVVDIVTAALGIKGANTPAKAGSVWTWSIICLVCSVINFILTVPMVGGKGTTVSGVVNVVVAVLFFVFANGVKKEGADRLS